MTAVYNISNEALEAFLAELKNDGGAQFEEMFKNFLNKNQKPKAKRGRPRKDANVEKNADAELENDGEQKPKARRGRPSKKNLDQNDPVMKVDDVNLPEMKQVDVEIKKDDEVKPKKSRGRPRKENKLKLDFEELDENADIDVPENDKKPVKPRKEKEEIDMEYWGDLDTLEFSRMVYEDDKSNKYWEYVHTDNRTLVRYGKIGSKGTIQQKTFEDEDSAIKYLDKEMKTKEKKGYTNALIRV